MSDLYIVRHGETTWNQEQKLQGRTDIDLNEKGYQDAHNLSIKLRDKGSDFIYCSPFKRTMATAQILSQQLDLPCTPHDGLLPRSFGPWEGEPISKIKQDNALLFDQLFMWPLSRVFKESPINSIESYLKVSQRAFKAFEEVGHHNSILVTHSGVIASILLALNYSSFEIPMINHDGFVHIVMSKGEYKVKEVCGLVKPVENISNRKSRYFAF
ncbi:MAG: histidine phosphatase family protein [Rhabdochlamydiaceae bacterium]|nr:histidine phosphatase family protein [Candidatus Amphrikana amoebophyrae]